MKLPSFLKSADVINNERGAAGWILLWALGIPIPLLLLLFLIRGGT